MKPVHYGEVQKAHLRVLYIYTVFRWLQMVWGNALFVLISFSVFLVRKKMIL